MATLESVIQKINLLIEDANDTTGSLHNNLRDAVDSLILGYGNIEVDSLAEIHVWSKYTIGGTVNETVQDSLYVDLAQKGSVDGRVYYADDYSIVDGALTLNNPNLIDLYNVSVEERKVILGKYINPVKKGGYYRVPSDAVITRSAPATGYHYVSIAPVYKAVYTGAGDEFVGIVVSEDSADYPQNGTQGGYKYVYNGTLNNAGGCDHVAVTQAVPSIAVSESGLITATSEQEGGLVAAGTKTTTKQLSTQGGVAVKPGSTSKTAVAAGKYTTGDVIVMGDSQLVASNIKSGVSIFGVTGSYEATGGTALPTLTNPGTADDLAEDKQLIDANGNIVTGAVTTNDAGVTSWFDDKPIYRSGSGSNLKLGFSHEFGYANLFRVGSKFALFTPASNFGDASASDVAKGKTFTSAEGAKVVGTMVPSSFTVTDDGAGNVTITSSAITDNDGNVVIA